MKAVLKLLEHAFILELDNMSFKAIFLLSLCLVAIMFAGAMKPRFSQPASGKFEPVVRPQDLAHQKRWKVFDYEHVEKYENYLITTSNLVSFLFDWKRSENLKYSTSFEDRGLTKFQFEKLKVYLMFRWVLECFLHSSADYFLG